VRAIVTLTPSELTQAALVGVMRHVQNLKIGRRAGHNLEAGVQDWQYNLAGACGEMVVAKHFNLYWGGTGVFRGGDVGRLQVRLCPHFNGRLILHHDDQDDAAFVLVRGHAFDYEVVGWIWGRDGKRDEWWTDPTRQNRHAFFVPEHALRGIGTLRISAEGVPWDGEVGRTSPGD
jgi:hypothetical protein